MNNYLKNKKHLIENNAYDPSLEHEACGVGLIATTDGKKSRKVVMPYHSSYDLIEELEEVADSLVKDLKG